MQYETLITDSRAARDRLAVNLERLSRNRAWLESTMAEVDREWSRAERQGQSVIVHLEGRLESLPIIEQAKGVLIAESGCSADQAWDTLRRASQRTNIKVRDLAAQIVAAAQQRQAVQAPPNG